MDRIEFFAALVVFKSAEHHAGNFITSVGPDIDDLIVAFAVGNNTLAVLLFDLPDLFISILQLGLLLFRNDHVGNSD